ncbi:MAG TPA: type II toxin-antitoxin system RelE/ParE family toxin [Terracidiphilus sp.]|nr:type II toxin-antitoxin system RelE/ParE family toxin [Terracidiphilus sp.]
MNASIRSAAREDILRQFAWYLDEKGSAQIARRFLEAVEQAIDRISKNPRIGSPKFFENPTLKGLRSQPVPGFSAVRVYYLHSESELCIIRVLHGKRDLHRLLEKSSGDAQEP